MTKYNTAALSAWIELDRVELTILTMGLLSLVTLLSAAVAVVAV